MNRNGARFWTWAVTACVVGVLVRVWFVHHTALVTGDGLIYGDIAKNLLRHGVYGFSQGSTAPDKSGVSPTLIRLPGYPFFLAACFRLFGMEHYGAVLYVQALIDLGTCCLAGALAGRLFGRRAGLAVLWMAALCPFTASYTAIVLTETSVLATIAMALYGFVRWQEAGGRAGLWMWVIVLALAWSILLRPEQILFAVALLAAMLWASLRGPARVWRGGGTVLLAAVCVLFPLLPWTARNWQVFHVFQPLVPKYANDPDELAPLGFSQWYRTWGIEFTSTEDVYWNYPGDHINVSRIPERAFDTGSQAATAELRAQTVQLLDDYNADFSHGQEVNPRLDARFGALGRERIQAHPLLSHVGLPVARVLDMMLRPRTEMMDLPLDWWRWKQHPAKSVVAVGYGLLSLSYIAAGLTGFVVWRRRGWRAGGGLNGRILAYCMAGSIVLRGALLLTIDNSEPRYTLEFFPVLLVCAGALFARSERPGRVEQDSGR